MQKIALPLIVLMLISSCSTQAPKENEVKELVKLWYEQQNQMDGAGRWDVKGVTVLSIEKDEQRKDVFNSISLAAGIHHPASLSGPQPGKNFSDTVRMSLQWNGARWITAD